MDKTKLSVVKRTLAVSLFLLIFLLSVSFLGLSTGSTGQNIREVFTILSGYGDQNSTMSTIVWQIRFPRVILAALVGATLSLGGLVFQALLRNPLAEPYILGISGGSAVGAIVGILLGLSRFSGVAFLAFGGSMLTLAIILSISSKSAMKKDSMILSGVMVNAFCSSIIMFLISITRESELHTIVFWLMGDLSTSDAHQTLRLSFALIPCFIVIFIFAKPLNLLLMGEEMASSMGVNVRLVSIVTLTITSFMISATVSHSGLLGFVGLVIPHLLRIVLGPDHRILIPSCILGGGAYLVLCDLMARFIPSQGEIPVGVVTAMIGAPLFIYLLQRSKR